MLNPKVAVLDLSLLPQFIDPAIGRVLSQAVILGTIQIAVGIMFNAVIILSAASVAMLLTRRPTFALVQRWLMGTVLAGLAIRMATEGRR